MIVSLHSRIAVFRHVAPLMIVSHDSDAHSSLQLHHVFSANHRTNTSPSLATGPTLLPLRRHPLVHLVRVILRLPSSVFLLITGILIIFTIIPRQPRASLSRLFTLMDSRDGVVVLGTSEEADVVTIVYRQIDICSPILLDLGTKVAESSDVCFTEWISSD